jgi:hypothetical protein
MAGTRSEFGQLWATCGDSDDGGNYFMGRRSTRPTSTSSGPTTRSRTWAATSTCSTSGAGVFFALPMGITNLGSHLDMLHSTPFCRGIASAGEGKQYFVFNSFNKSIDFYDFRPDHGIGFRARPSRP